MIGTESAVLTISHLEPTEVSFETVGVTDDLLIVQVVKHMGKRMDDQAAGAFEIAEYVTTFGREIDCPAVLLFPVDELIDPPIAVDGCADGTELPKQVSQVQGIRSLGTLAAPGHSLALNMYQTALQGDSRPLRAQVTQQLRISVGGDAGGNQSATGQLRAERCHAPRSLAHTIEPDDAAVGLRVHHSGDRSLAAAEIGAVDEQVPIRGQVLPQWRRLIQPVVNDTPQRPRAVAALLPQLPYAVAFAHPSLKPNPLPCPAVTHTVAGEGASTDATPPALSPTATVSVPKRIGTATVRTCLFETSSDPSGINAVSI